MKVPSVRLSGAVKDQRVNYHYMADAMRRLEWDLHQKILTEGRIPEEWHEIARGRAEPERVRITLGVEADVARFYRSMGRNYQARMNEVLRSFMHARLAGLLQGGETLDYFKARKEKDLDGMKPGWGTRSAEMEGRPGMAARLADNEGVPMGEESRAGQRDAAAWLRARE